MGSKSGKYFSNSRATFKWVFVMVVVGFAALAAGRLIRSIKTGQSRVGAPIPYTVTLRESIHAIDGKVTIGPQSTWAIRSDGSRVIRIVEKNSQRILNFASGVEVTINESNNTKSSIMKQNGHAASWQRDPNAGCINSLAGKPMTSTPETFAGSETIAGYRTAKVLSDGITSWYALDHGCALVKEKWAFATGDVTEKELVALVAGEPDARLFEVPANAREVTPSERVLGPQKECFGCPEATRERFQKLDAEYTRLAVRSQ